MPFCNMWLIITECVDDSCRIIKVMIKRVFNVFHRLCKKILIVKTYSLVSAAKKDVQHTSVYRHL